MTVELIYDRDCPNISPARANLMKAFAASGREARWIEWERGAPDSPAHVRGFGSPTVLVGGKDITGGVADSASASCRLYRTGSGKFGGVPSIEQITAALTASNSALSSVPGGWRSSLAAAPGIAAAFLPNIVCPACLPAYAGLVSAMGLGFVLDRGYLLLLTGALLILAVGALALRAQKLRRYGPLVVGLAGTIAVLAGKFAFDSSAVMYAGIAGLIGASVWSAWPVRALTAGCPTCGHGQPSTMSALKGSYGHGDEAKD